MCYLSRYLETASNSRWQVWRARRVEDELEERVESQLEGALNGRLQVMMMIIMLALMMIVMMMLMVGMSCIRETASTSRASSISSSIIIVNIFLLSLKIFNLTGAFISLMIITNQGIFCSGLERDPAESNITGIFATLKTF